MNAQGRPIRVVPLREGGGLATAAPRAAPATAQLTYRGGPLLSAVEVATVFWGAAWSEATAQSTAQSLNAFFQFVVASPYIDQLAEYGTPQHPIGRGRYVGTARVTDTAPAATVTDAAIRQMIQGALTRNALPAPTANTVYFAFLPPGVTVVKRALLSGVLRLSRPLRERLFLRGRAVPQLRGVPRQSAAARCVDVGLLARAGRGDHRPGAGPGVVRRRQRRDRGHLRLAE